ncbi:MAG TPA: DMT family transporter [Hyphomicrobiales bacterium]|nr:DMT family transporter [Hyphomicrobiales bacterium]
MRLAYLQLAGAMALVGANIPVAKAAIPFIPVFIFSLIRYGVSVAVLAPFVAHEPGGRFSDMSRSDWGYITLQALCGGLLYMVFMLYGLQYTSAMTAGIITSTVPMGVALLALILLGEKFGPLTGAALILAMVGILAVNAASPRQDVAPWPLLGNALVGAAVIAESLFVIFARRMAASLAPCRMAVAINAIGLLMVAPFAVSDLVDFSPSSVPLEIWLLPVLYALTSSALALILWYRGLSVVPASKAAIFTSTFPISAVAVSIIFLGEQLQWAHGIGLACVLAAIFIGTRSR